MFLHPPDLPFHNVKEDDEDDSRTKVKTTDEEISEGKHDDDLSEDINEPWRDWEETVDDKSADVDYDKGERYNDKES